jgi:hypothetical protein
MLLGSVDVVQLQQWSEQHCFGAALWFLRLLPSHLYSATALAFRLQGVLGRVRLT